MTIPSVLKDVLECKFGSGLLRGRPNREKKEKGGNSRGERRRERRMEREKKIETEIGTERGKEGKRKAEGERRTSTWIIYEYCKLIFAT